VIQYESNRGNWIALTAHRRINPFSNID